ncbi:2'-5' RNA ligase family protein [Nocardioides rotundus]|uniref:2'-5' RNA ligase family protein n=1 Tax=Nocardioides rotundus TaxID=1774216 RepID=UPI001CBC3F48|nr:2'-5' RNA ligase family protein [Nocardioides rotundus]UAL28704.1 2'-5' RNA ligase family protein [Nocardioides rotundus]
MPTIGVALAIPEPWARELQDYRTAVGDTTATQIPTHITLVPPTEVEGDLTDVHEHLTRAALRHEPFTVHLRGTGTFRPVSPVVFVAVAQGISACEVLAAELRAGPLAQELSFPYHPHVTIAHHLEDAALDRAYAELADFECVFDADHFLLYVHEDGIGWRPTREFPLGEIR